ncbi:hypothetical protein DFH09DRAFT_1078596 [Mycena vulgaris]|nr:hypothetical protein DFH09DRAFT_1078596 [Mycena vulgaris]
MFSPRMTTRTQNHHADPAAAGMCRALLQLATTQHGNLGRVQAGSRATRLNRAMTRKSSAPLSQSFVFPVYIVRVTPQRLENSDAFFGSRCQEGAAIDIFQLISSYKPAKVTGYPAYFAANLGAQPHPSLAPLLASKFPRPVKESVQDPQNSMGGSTAVGVVLDAVDNSQEDP